MTADAAPPRTRRPYAARAPIEVRREQLLDAALAIIVRDGYEAVSVDAVAREAGVTRPVVYGAYDGLRELLGALLDRQQARALAQLDQVLPASPDLSRPDEFVADVARRLIDLVRSEPATWRPVLFATYGAPEAVRTRVDADRENFRIQVAGLLELGLAARGGPAIDVEVAAHGIVAVLEHFGRVLLEDPQRFDTDRLVGTLTVLLAAVR